MFVGATAGQQVKHDTSICDCAFRRGGRPGCGAPSAGRACRQPPRQIARTQEQTPPVVACRISSTAICLRMHETEPIIPRRASALRRAAALLMWHDQIARFTSALIRVRSTIGIARMAHDRSPHLSRVTSGGCRRFHFLQALFA